MELTFNKPSFTVDGKLWRIIATEQIEGRQYKHTLLGEGRERREYLHSELEKFYRAGRLKL